MILVSYYWQLSCRYFQKMSSNSPLSTWIHRLNIPQLHLRCSLVLSSGWCGRVVWSALMCPVIVTGVSHNVTPSQYLHWPVTYRQSRDPATLQLSSAHADYTENQVHGCWINAPSHRILYLFDDTVGPSLQVSAHNLWTRDNLQMCKIKVNGWFARWYSGQH